MPKLTANVMLRKPGHGPVFLPAGSEVPDWAADQVGDHVLDVPAQSGGDIEAPRAVGDPPPQAGPGSSRSRWLDYAIENRVHVRDDASREDIIEACTAAGVPTE